jgi:hypothetical protein
MKKLQQFKQAAADKVNVLMGKKTAVLADQSKEVHSACST